MEKLSKIDLLEYLLMLQSKEDIDIDRVLDYLESISSSREPSAAIE